MKRYNAIKNLMIASATAALYYGWIVDSITPVKKIIATLAVFGIVYFLMRDADKSFENARREKRHARKTT